jgi:hypothetical protein
MTAPRYAYEMEILHRLALHMLNERKARYPQAVTDGKMSQAQAERGILVMAEIERIRERSKLQLQRQTVGTIDHKTTATERRDCLAKIAAATAKVAQASPVDSGKASYAQAVAAMLWHAEHAVNAS